MNNIGNNLPQNNINADIAGIQGAEDAAMQELNDGVLEEVDVEEDDDSVDEKGELQTKDKKQKKINRARKKAHQSKHDSTRFINKETDLHDLTRDFIQKAADRKKKITQQKIQEKFREEYQKNLKENFEKNLKSNFQDKASISSVLLSQQKAEKAQQSKQNTSQGQLFTDKSLQKEESAHQVAGANFAAQTQENLKKEKAQHVKSTQKLSTGELREALNEYVAAFSDDLIFDKPEKKERIRVLKEKLQENGVNTKKLRTVEQQVTKHIGQDLRKKLKNNFLQVALSYDRKDKSGEMIKNYQAYKTLMDYGEESGLINSDPFKINKMKEEAKQEVRDFLATELDRTLTETKLKTDDIQVLIKEFDKFNEVASFVRFDPGEFLKDFLVKTNDMGLLEHNWRDEEGVLDTDVGTGSQYNGQGRQGNQDDQNQELQGFDENLEVSDNKLRQLYLRQYTKSGVFEAGKLALDIFSLESKVKAKSGASHVEKLQKEARGIAKLKLVIMLRESYEERATLPELKGPEFENLDKKFKVILDGLKKSGVKISKQYLKEVRDQANRSMFTLMKEEYTNVEMHLKSNPSNVSLLQKSKQYKKILNRLKMESDILEDIKPKLMQDLNFLSDLNIIEAA